MRAAQETVVASDPRAAIVDLDDLKQAGLAHFVPDEYDMIGSRLFDAVLDIRRRRLSSERDAAKESA